MEKEENNDIMIVYTCPTSQHTTIRKKERKTETHFFNATKTDTKFGLDIQIT